jgi:hypothetical protein
MKISNMKLSFKSSILVAAISLTVYLLLCLPRQLFGFTLSDYYGLWGFYAKEPFYWLYMASIVMIFAAAYRERIVPTRNVWTRIASGIYIAIFACLFIIRGINISYLSYEIDTRDWWIWFDVRVLRYMTVVVLWLMYAFYDKLFVPSVSDRPSSLAKAQLAVAWLEGIVLVLSVVTIGLYLSGYELLEQRKIFDYHAFFRSSLRYVGLLKLWSLSLEYVALVFIFAQILFSASRKDIAIVLAYIAIRIHLVLFIVGNAVMIIRSLPEDEPIEITDTIP